MKRSLLILLLFALTVVSATILGSCQLNEKEPVSIERITLDRDMLDLEFDETVILNVSIWPGDTTDKTVEWRSSDPSVVTVNAGRVTAVGGGIATVSASSGGMTAECEVRVSVEATEGLEYSLLADGTYEVSIGQAGDKKTIIILDEYEGKKVKRVANNGFFNASSLEKLVVIGDVLEIGDSSFSQCKNLSKVILTDKITLFSQNAFSFCSSLRSINIPQKLKTIGEFAFWGCSSLKTINLPDGLNAIGKSVFADCSVLSRINIPESVSFIDSAAFSMCSMLTIYPDRKEAPSGWSNSWNSTDCKVVWKDGTVGLELNGGAVPKDSGVGKYFSIGDLIVLPTPNRYGYTFKGWFLDPDFAGEPTVIYSAKEATDLVFYANWERSFNFVHLHTGGALYTEFDARITVGEKIVLPENVFQYGSTFEGWYTDKTYTERVTELTPEVDEDVHLYAKWNSDSYWSMQDTVTYSKYFLGGANPGTGDDIGSALIDAGTTRLTLRMDHSSEGDKNWNNGSIRIRTGPSYAELHFVKFVDGRMLTYSGIMLTEENSDDTVDVVIDFAEKALYFYVNGEYVYREQFTNDRHICSDLTYYNYTTAPADNTLVRGNLFQLTNVDGDEKRYVSYDAVHIFIGDIYSDLK